MAHFAQLDSNNIVQQVIVIDNKDITVNGIESEQAGKDFITKIGLNGIWIQTSYNGRIRDKFAAIGDTYDLEKDIFYSVNDSLPNYLYPWVDVDEIISPSILFDAPTRSANIWVSSVINQAFPTAFQRWGCFQQHNPESFEIATEKFDAIVTTVRTPLDSIASSIVAFNAKTDDEILGEITATFNFLTSINQNKNNIFVFKFEDVTTDPTLAIAQIAEKLNVEAKSYKPDDIANLLANSQIFSVYSLPIDNTAQLNIAKTILSQPQFADLLAQCNSVYQEIIG